MCNALQVGCVPRVFDSRLSALVATDQCLWISANPKETELTYVKPGQVGDRSTVDSYPGVAWKGKVESSISPASGSSFSLLPAQNTTGNWGEGRAGAFQCASSIVDTWPASRRLRVGMSTIVDVDTGHASAACRILPPNS